MYKINFYDLDCQQTRKIRRCRSDRKNGLYVMFGPLFVCRIFANVFVNTHQRADGIFKTVISSHVLENSYKNRFFLFCRVCQEHFLKVLIRKNDFAWHQKETVANDLHSNFVLKQFRNCFLNPNIYICRVAWLLIIVYFNCKSFEIRKKKKF